MENEPQHQATLASPPRTVGCAGTLAHPVGNLPTADGTSSAEALPVPNSTSTSADDGAEGK